MKVDNKEFSVKLVGTLKTPEIKTLLPKLPLKAYEIFANSKALSLTQGKEDWNNLEESEKLPFIAQSDKQRDLADKIKVLAKQHYSLAMAISNVEQSLKTLNEEYSALIGSRSLKSSKNAGSRGFYKKNGKNFKGKLAFEAFSAKWKEENSSNEEMNEEKRQIVSQAWKSLTREEKQKYYN